MSKTHKNGCTCGPCKQYYSKATQRYHIRTHARARGVQYDIDLIPVDDSREAVQQARKRGLSYNEISRLTGVERQQLCFIEQGKRKRVQRRTQKKILQGLSEPDVRNIAPTSLVPITVEPQIVHSLEAQGWTSEHLKEILQNNGQGSGTIIDNVFKNKKALARNLKQVYWLADVIGDKLGPSHRGRMLMQARGIFPMKHYNENGRLNERTLNADQRAALRRVR